MDHTNNKLITIDVCDEDKFAVMQDSKKKERKKERKKEKTETSDLKAVHVSTPCMWPFS